MVPEQILVVAEVGNNHEGDVAIAHKLIDLAAEAGADIVKFQTFIPELFVSRSDVDRFNRLKSFQLSFAQFKELRDHAHERGLKFWSTALDMESAVFLGEIADGIKIASSDNTFYPLLKRVGSFGKPVGLPTGMIGKELIREALEALREGGGPCRTYLLHCVTSYPVQDPEANLRAVVTLKESFPECIAGYSDHTLGNVACLAAVVLGARIVEKHFTLDKNYSSFRDHQLSADPEELKSLVADLRRLEQMLGSGEKVPQHSERQIEQAVRRSIVATRDLAAGEVIDERCFTWVRPGGGLPPGSEKEILGKRVSTPIRMGEWIQLSSLS